MKHLIGVLIAILLALPVAAADYEIYSIYANTQDLEVAVGDTDSRTVTVAVPVGAIGVVGWRLSLWAQDREAKWSATAFVVVGGIDQDHFKARERDTLQGPPVILPGLVELGAPASAGLRVKVTNEDTKPVKIRANVWVWYALPLVVESLIPSNGGGVPGGSFPPPNCVPQPIPHQP